MTAQIPQPDKKIQPIRVIEDRRAFEQEATVIGVDDLVDFRAFYTREVLLYGAVAGDDDGVPVVLLHGFPDFWLSFSRQIRPLVEAGARVVIPDQRGYNRSEKPADIDAYRIHRLGRDILDVMDAASMDRAHLVGHDWGGAVSWWLAEHHPDRLETATILNCPHPEVMQRAVGLNNVVQMLRSWYIALFQIPWLSEFVAQLGGHRLLRMALQSAGPEAFSDAEIELHRRAWEQPQAVRSMFNWYRAARRTMFDTNRGRSGRNRTSKISVPMRVIWGEQDVVLDRSLVAPSAQRVADCRVDYVGDATHWVHRDRPGFVARRLIETVGLEPPGR